MNLIVQLHVPLLLPTRSVLAALESTVDLDEVEQVVVVGRVDVEGAG